MSMSPENIILNLYYIFCRSITICQFISLRWNIADIFKRAVIFFLSMLFNLSQKVNSNTIVRHYFACDGVVVHSGNCIMKSAFHYSHILYQDNKLCGFFCGSRWKANMFFSFFKKETRYFSWGCAVWQFLQVSVWAYLKLLAEENKRKTFRLNRKIASFSRAPSVIRLRST